MDNLSTAGTGISSQIGALELGDYLTSHSDGAVEAAGANMMANPPTHVFVGTGCRGIDDGALEAAGTNLAPATYPVPLTVCCPRIDDGALEAAGEANSGTTYNTCGATRGCR